MAESFCREKARLLLPWEQLNIFQGGFSCFRKRGVEGKGKQKKFKAEVQEGIEKLQRRKMGSKYELVKTAAYLYEADRIMEFSVDQEAGELLRGDKAWKHQ